MNDFRIAGDIESLGNRRMLGCLGRFLLVFFVALVVYAIAVKHTSDRSIRAAAALAVSGVILGFATSILTSQSRKLLIGAFVALPLVIAIVLFAFRTLFGMSHALPLRLVLAPLFFSAGFVAGQIRRSSEF